MELTSRPYAGPADQRLMAALVRDSLAENLHIMDLPYRLSSWALDDPQNCSLWFDLSGRLVGWALMLTPMWSVDLVCLPGDGAADTYAQMLAWADARARAALGTPSGRPIWFVNVREDQRQRRALLEASGFRDQSYVDPDPWRKVFLRHTGAPAVAGAAALSGFTIRPLAGPVEVDAYVALHRAAFGSPNMTAEWRRRTLDRPEYDPELDLVALDSAGSLLGFCIGWYAAAGPGGQAGGQIEPIGVLPGGQRRGVGRALAGEVLRRLYRRGARAVYVETDETDPGTLAFYESLGFQICWRVPVYRKDYAG